MARVVALAILVVLSLCIVAAPDVGATPESKFIPCLRVHYDPESHTVEVEGQPLGGCS